MKFDLNTKVVALLLVLSISSFVLHRVGAFNTSLNLLAEEAQYFHVTNSQGALEIEHEYKNNHLSMRCVIGDVNDRRYCGVTVKLHENPAYGVDFSGYENILIDVELEAPDDDAPIRLMFRNFDEQYSQAKDSSSLKYNTIQFVPSKESGTRTISVDSFQVATWWIEEYKIGYEQAQKDISNVSLVEVETALINTPGEYVITIDQLELQGHYFSEFTLMKGIFAVWLLATIFMVRRQHSILKLISTHDPLTKKLNRRGLNHWLERCFSDGERRCNISMFYIDIDDFKKVNDQYGHLVGDRLLCEYCRVVESELDRVLSIEKKSDYVLARLSGDEFAVILEGVSEKTTLFAADRLLDSLSKSILIDGIELNVNSSIGVANCTDRVSGADVLIDNADAAMYYSKKNGKNQYKVFDDEMFKCIDFRKTTANSVREALARDEFDLLFMPIYSSSHHGISAVEVLLRCTSPALKGVGPDTFIPVAEEFGLIRDIDLWVIEATFKVISRNADFVRQHNMAFCINISALELVNKAFPRRFKYLLDKYAIDAKIIELELTETSLIDVDNQSIELLHELRSFGVTLSLDDFGTGYTAFNQLLNYPVNSLKIDRSFVGNITNGRDGDSTMVDVILAIAKSYNLDVVAEGVETGYQYKYLSEKKCAYLQGYYMSKPIDWMALVSHVTKPVAFNSLIDVDRMLPSAGLT